MRKETNKVCLSIKRNIEVEESIFCWKKSRVKVKGDKIMQRGKILHQRNNGRELKRKRNTIREKMNKVMVAKQ